jgi:hypothetical protein
VSLQVDPTRWRPEEDALRAYINSYRHVCHIDHSREPTDYVQNQAWLASRIIGDVPPDLLNLPYQDDEGAQH